MFLEIVMPADNSKIGSKNLRGLVHWDRIVKRAFLDLSPGSVHLSFAFYSSFTEVFLELYCIVCVISQFQELCVARNTPAIPAGDEEADPVIDVEPASIALSDVVNQQGVPRITLNLAPDECRDESTSERSTTSSTELHEKGSSFWMSIVPESIELINAPVKIVDVLVLHPSCLAPEDEVSDAVDGAAVDAAVAVDEYDGDDEKKKESASLDGDESAPTGGLSSSRKFRLLPSSSKDDGDAEPLDGFEIQGMEEAPIPSEKYE
ncbi:hypothetical protein CEXT_298941 [Caerostris extrusa]|uniref:Uncharacterized protein n=1 Tax=Caerostris extrusa TaxID=172846 RepID=A0AAV4V7W0_CAEEX|nr:hypothetical protein CEXT_298941 [Caerostris extrusa]